MSSNDPTATRRPWIGMRSKAFPSNSVDAANRVKHWTTEDGKVRGGKPSTRGSLHATLTNRFSTAQ